MAAAGPGGPWDWPQISTIHFRSLQDLDRITRKREGGSPFETILIWDDDQSDQCLRFHSPSKTGNSAPKVGVHDVFPDPGRSALSGWSSSSHTWFQRNSCEFPSSWKTGGGSAPSSSYPHIILGQPWGKSTQPFIKVRVGTFPTLVQVLSHLRRKSGAQRFVPGQRNKENGGIRPKDFWLLVMWNGISLQIYPCDPN